MIIDQNMNWAMLISDLLPQLSCSFDIRKVGIVEVHLLECGVVRQRFDVLDELRLQVRSDVHDDQVNAADLTSSNELLG